MHTIKHQRDKIVKLRSPDDIYSTPTKECSGLTTETGTLRINKENYSVLGQYLDRHFNRGLNHRLRIPGDKTFYRKILEREP